MTRFKRYAIYYAPDPGPLAAFGANWLGWDMIAGAATKHPQIPDLDVPTLTENPRKYGLHGTVKAPFRLASGCTVDDLDMAFRSLCARLTPITLEALELTRLGGFLALTVTGDTAPLGALAAKAVTDLDHLRAPLTQAELDRRRKSHLSPRHTALLTRWGYPFVMEEFRFHITLTGKIPRAQAEHVRTVLEPVIAPLLPRPFTVGSLCLVGEDEQGRFHLVHRYPLTG